MKINAMLEKKRWIEVASDGCVDEMCLCALVFFLMKAEHEFSPAMISIHLELPQSRSDNECKELCRHKDTCLQSHTSVC